MSNKAFRRAVDCLAHPLALVAIAVLALNAFVLQRAWPSWWTGKVGDAVWLFFVPFLAAAALSWLVPQRWTRQEAVVGLGALTITGLGFALAKACPAVNTFLARSFLFLSGRPAKLALDPTDLLALPALAGAGLLWKKAPRPSARPILRGLAVVLAIAVTAADATDPRTKGVICLLEKGNAILAVEEFYDTGKSQTPEWLLYRSDDGGATWSPNYVDRMSTNPCANTQLSWPLHDETNHLDYSLAPGEGIYVTREGELASHVEYTLTAPIYDAAIHAPTGNALFALGASGVLVRTPAGQWNIHYVVVSYKSVAGPGIDYHDVTRIPLTATPRPTKPTATPRPTATIQPTAWPSPHHNAAPTLSPTPTRVATVSWEEAIQRGADGRYYLKQYADHAGQPLAVGIPARTRHSMTYYEYQMLSFYTVVRDRPQARTVAVVDQAGNVVHQYSVWTLSVVVFDPPSGRLIPRDLIVWGQNGTSYVAVGTMATTDGQLTGSTGFVTGTRNELLGKLAPGTAIGVRMAYGITFKPGYSWQARHPFPGETRGEQFQYFYGVILGLGPERQLETVFRLPSAQAIEEWLAGGKLPSTIILGDASNPGISYISQFR